MGSLSFDGYCLSPILCTCWHRRHRLLVIVHADSRQCEPECFLLFRSVPNNLLGHARVYRHWCRNFVVSFIILISRVISILVICVGKSKERHTFRFRLCRKLSGAVLLYGHFHRLCLWIIGNSRLRSRFANVVKELHYSKLLFPNNVSDYSTLPVSL